VLEFRRGPGGPADRLVGFLANRPSPNAFWANVGDVVANPRGDPGVGTAILERIAAVRVSRVRSRTAT
jgi:hypothetical protein